MGERRPFHLAARLDLGRARGTGDRRDPRRSSPGRAGRRGARGDDPAAARDRGQVARPTSPPICVRRARQSADIIFFDALDPKPRTGEFPTEITIDYELQPAFKASPPPEPIARSILLPITTPPVQVPRIVSAGLALSPYSHADDYSSTDQRQRVLWFEFAEPPLDPERRVLRARPRVGARSPAPRIGRSGCRKSSSRRCRSIRNRCGGSRPDSRATRTGCARCGCSARRPAPGGTTSCRCRTISPRRRPSSSGSSSTKCGSDTPPADGRRRRAASVRRCAIAGVQHPAPPLECQAARGKTHILVRAPFATPVYQGRNMRPRHPRSDMWSLLYARVRQVDAEAWRNVLIAQTRLFPPEMERIGRGRCDCITAKGCSG